MSDIRISEFLGATTVEDSDYLTIVSNGQNKKVLKSDFVAGLGVTGTIVQDGGVTGTAVLDTQGTVNNIRNLENGAGVKSTVSAENGITLSHNFLQDGVGAPLLRNATALQPTFVSLEAGDGISIVSVDNHIEISSSITPVSTKTVLVNELSDFPTPVANVITLLDDREYFLIADVNLGINRLVLGENCSISSTDSVIITLTYTGTGDLFTMGDTLNRIHSLSISCVNGRLFNRSDTTSKIFRMHDISFSADRFGIFTSVNGVARFTNVSPTVITTSGIEFVGNFRSILYESSAATMTAGALWNLGTATFDSFLVDTILVTLNGSSVMLSGAAASANINTGGIGLVRVALTSGAGSPLSGITVEDALWTFKNNDDIQDTRPDALIVMPSNATNTVITTLGVAVKVLGTWIIQRVSQFTGTTGGRATYNGGRPAVLPVTISVTVGPVSGTNKTVSTYVAINGTVVANSKRSNIASTGSPVTITTPWQYMFNTGDYVEIFVANETDSIDLLVSNATLRIN